jgi:Protein of unknown function (DUF3750)
MPPMQLTGLGKMSDKVSQVPSFAWPLAATIYIRRPSQSNSPALPKMIPHALKLLLLCFALLIATPIALSALWFWLGSAAPRDWWSADRSSIGLLPSANQSPEASIRIFSARTVRWRSIFATHSWIVIKDAGAKSYERFDYTAWGDPIRVNGFVADGRWFGRPPELVADLKGSEAERVIPKIRRAIASYRYRHSGDYRAWPGPNSNTFVASIMRVAPELRAKLPNTAIGKDFLDEGRWLSLTPSKTGVQFSLAGYGGITVGWIEGIEVNLLGAAFGIEVRRPAINLPGLGRFGI